MSDANRSEFLGALTALCHVCADQGVVPATHQYDRVVALYDAAFPPGYVLVPEEPTEAMLKAFDIDFVRFGNLRHAYRAMIAAAQ